MELCNITLINRLISSTITRTCVIRSIIGLPSVGSCHSKHSSEYFSDSDDDRPSRQGGFINRSRGGFQQNNYGNRRSENRRDQEEESYENDGYEVDNRRRPNSFSRDENRGSFGGEYRQDRGSFGGEHRQDRGSFGGDNLRQLKWENESLSVVKKNTYIPSETVDGRPDEEVQAFRSENQMTVQGNDIPNPILQFSDYQFSDEVKKLLQNKGFERPTPIQAQSWPVAYKGRDLVGIGQTGSGKTLGYILPAMAHIQNQGADAGQSGSEGMYSRATAQPIGLVMAPTRELAQQIDGVAREVRESRSFRTACLYGGSPKGMQMKQLAYRPSICIATPGRLMDFLEMGTINLKRCSYLVIDEADRMLDMGFEPQIRKIVSQIRPDRQTLMWSATWPKEIRSLASEFLDNYVQIKLGTSDLTANKDIIQIVEVCAFFEKEEKLQAALKEELENPDCRVLIFAETKRQVDRLMFKLRDWRVSSAGIHGDHTQARRDSSLNGFRQGRYKVLIATNVAARGIDVEDITKVINYDFPNNIEDYIHRIGRTGRAGKSGKALSFLTEEDSAVVKDLLQILKQSNQEIDPKLADMAQGGYGGKKKGGFGGGKRGYGGGNRGGYRPRDDDSYQRGGRW